MSSASPYLKDTEIPSNVRNNSTFRHLQIFFFEIRSQCQRAVHNTYKHAEYFSTKCTEVLMSLHSSHSVKHPYKNDPISHKDLPPKGFSDCIFICTFLPRFQQTYDSAIIYIKTIITKSIPKAEVMGKSRHV